jgi:hypothetical protein
MQMITKLTSYHLFSGISIAPMVRIHTKYELLEEIPAEETVVEHLGKFETLKMHKVKLQSV